MRLQITITENKNLDICIFLTQTPTQLLTYIRTDSSGLNMPVLSFSDFLNLIKKVQPRTANAESRLQTTEVN